MDRVYFLVKDPHWTLVIWELAVQTLVRAEFQDAQLCLRVHDVTDIVFDGGNSHWHFDVEIGGASGHWYLYVPIAGRVYLTEAGFRAWDGAFFAISRSNAAHVPREAPSENRSVTWSRIELI